MTPTFFDDLLTVYRGDLREVLPQMPEHSVTTVVTSPPYWQLRDYNDCPHQKAVIGGGVGRSSVLAQQRKSADRYTQRSQCEICHNDTVLGRESTVQKYVDNTVEWARLVRRVLHPAGLFWLNIGDTVRERQHMGVPWRTALALQDDGWELRSPIVWHKPNATPESHAVRPTRAYEMMFLLTGPAGFYNAYAASKPESMLRDVWHISTEGLKEAHFATFPRRLVMQCLMGSASTICSSCGAPYSPGLIRRKSVIRRSERGKVSPAGRHVSSGTQLRVGRRILHGQEQSCHCEAPPRPSTVLDPFAGSGTTGLVAGEMGRRAILIEQNETYLRLLLKRNGRA